LKEEKSFGVTVDWLITLKERHSSVNKEVHREKFSFFSPPPQG
jgi:hypothetical protein